MIVGEARREDCAFGACRTTCSLRSPGSIGAEAVRSWWSHKLPCCRRKNDVEKTVGKRVVDAWILPHLQAVGWAKLPTALADCLLAVRRPATVRHSPGGRVERVQRREGASAPMAKGPGQRWLPYGKLPTSNPSECAAQSLYLVCPELRYTASHDLRSWSSGVPPGVGPRAWRDPKNRASNLAYRPFSWYT